MKLKNVLKIIIVILIVFIVICLIEFLRSRFYKPKGDFGAKTAITKEMQIELNLLEKFYGKFYVEEAQKDIRNETEEIRKSATKNVKDIENPEAYAKTTTYTIFGIPKVTAQVIPDNELPISKSREEWQFNLIDIYYNQEISQEEKEAIINRLKEFYAKYKDYTYIDKFLKKSIEEILVENNITFSN